MLQIRNSLRTVLAIPDRTPSDDEPDQRTHAMNREPDPVWIDANQLQQVIINIIMNSVDAMAGRTGPGVEEETLGRLFEPFCTTKEPGKGTGLGLADCYRIVEAAGGSIHAADSKEGGLEVSVTLPLCTEETGDRHCGQEKSSYN